MCYEGKQDLAPMFMQMRFRETRVRGIPMSWAMYKFLDVFPSVSFMVLLFIPVKRLWHMKMLKALHIAACDGLALMNDVALRSSLQSNAFNLNQF